MDSNIANPLIQVALVCGLSALGGVSAANMLDTEPQTRNSPVIEVPESIKLEPFSGGASYEYRFEVPLGTGGLTPELALSYSSFTRNTDIERSTRFGPPTYVDAQDEFELDGGRLVRDPTSPSTRGATMLLEFTTKGGQVLGPYLYLPGNYRRDMGRF